MGYLALVFNKLFQKKWFFALFIAMIILLIVESSVIVFFVFVSGLGKQAFPSLSLSFHLRSGCSALTATMVSSTADNRTFEYSCSGSGALRMPLSGWGGPADCCGADSILVSPSFTLPREYLSLSLVNTELSSCKGQPQMKLQNGQNMTLGGPSLNPNGLSYDYCAVIAGQMGSIDGFSIHWEEIPWPGGCCTLSAPAQLPVPAGQRASFIVTVSSRGAYFGNVSLSLGFAEGGYIGEPNRYTPTINASLTTSMLTLETRGSNSTMVTVYAFPGAAPYAVRVTVYAYPGRGYYSNGYADITVKII